MKNRTVTSIAILALTITLTLLTDSARAQLMSNNGSSVSAYFAAKSEFYKDSDPTGAVWGLAGSGPYPSGAGIPAVPPAPTPSITVPAGNAFSGTTYTSNFNDGATFATSKIGDLYPTTPILTSDARITIPGWNFTQVVSATGYAYEQINFASNYLITSNPGLGASVSPSIPIFVNGAVQPGPGSPFAQFDAVISYSWIPVTITASGLPTPSGPTVPLGSLSYAFYQPGPGTFAPTVPSVGSLAATPAGDGILAIDGEMWIAGDPFTLNVSTVPEPASLGLIGLGVIALARKRKRA